MIIDRDENLFSVIDARDFVCRGALVDTGYTVASGATSITVNENIFIISRAGIYQPVRIPAATFPLTDGIINYIAVNNTTYQYEKITDLLVIDYLAYFPVFTIPRTGTIAHVLNWDASGESPIEKMIGRFIRTRRFERYEGLFLSVDATRHALISAGKVYYGIVNYEPSSVNSNTDIMIRCVLTNGTWVLSQQTQLENVNYNGAAGLVPLTTNRYAVNFVYRGIEDAKHIYYVIGQGDYTLTQAQAAQPPASLPFIIASHAILTGRVIYQKSSDTVIQVDSAYSVAFTGTGAISHTDLLNLTTGDAGHTQFAFKPSTGTVLSKSISIIDRDGLTHTLVFNNGLLISHTTA